MAEIKQTFTIKLSYKEAGRLKAILGGITDIEYSDLCINGELRESFRDIYNKLPHDEDYV